MCMKLENAPSKSGEKSGRGRGNNPPQKLTTSKMVLEIISTLENSNG